MSAGVGLLASSVRLDVSMLPMIEFTMLVTRDWLVGWLVRLGG